jgi:DNA-binding PadR family transcriptional regulator
MHCHDHWSWSQLWAMRRHGRFGGHHRYGHGFGPGRFGGGEDGSGRAGRVFGPGDLRLVLLALIAERPRHGYELIKEIEQRFGGAYAPSPGSVYPTLTLLEELGHIRASAVEGGKRLFEITAEGRAFLAENQAAVDGVMNRMDLAARAMAGGAAPEVIYQAMQTLRTALMLHRAGWSAVETERVRKIIERAARDIIKGE